MINREERQIKTQDGTVTCTVHLEYPVLEQGSNGLNQAFEDWRAENETFKMYTGEKFGELAEEMLKNDAEKFIPYFVYQSMEGMRTDERIVSFLVNYSYFAGGTHSFDDEEGLNFDAETRKRLALSDVVTDEQLFCRTAETYVIDYLEKMDQDHALFDNYKQMVHTLLENPTWYMTQDGFGISMQDTTVFPHGYGMVHRYRMVQVPIPYEQFAEIIREEYLQMDKS